MRLISELAEEGKIPWLLLCALDLPLSLGVDIISAPFVLLFFWQRETHPEREPGLTSER